jgi:hypothetical protein
MYALTQPHSAAKAVTHACDGDAAAFPARIDLRSDTVTKPTDSVSATRRCAAGFGLRERSQASVTSYDARAARRCAGRAADSAASGLGGGLGGTGLGGGGLRSSLR